MSNELPDEKASVAAVLDRNFVPTKEEVDAQVAAEQETQKSESTAATDNRIAELLRKVNKLSEVDKKVEQLLAYVSQTQAKQAQPSSQTSYDPDGYMTRGEYQAFKMAEQRDIIKSQQAANFQKAMQMFPELDRASEKFDAGFYELTDKFFADFNERDPEAPIKAAELAALRMNKIQTQARQNIINDESRRTRLLGEGGISPKSTQTEAPSHLNERRLKNLLGVDPKRVQARIKANPDRYSDGK